MVSLLQDQSRIAAAGFALASAVGWVADRAPYQLLAPVSQSFVDEIWPAFELRTASTPYPWVCSARCELIATKFEPPTIWFVVEWRHVLETKRYGCLAAPDPNDSMWWIAARVREAIEALSESVRKGVL